MVSRTTPYTPCVIDRPMNSHGGLTLSAVTGSRTYQVVEYATAAVRETLSMAAAGSTVRVWLEPLGSRGDAWEAVEVASGVDIPQTKAAALGQPLKH